MLCGALKINTTLCQLNLSCENKRFEMEINETKGHVMKTISQGIKFVLKEQRLWVKCFR